MERSRRRETLDYYKLKVEAGAGLTFHVRSQRLLNRLHDMQTRVDPMITLKTAAGMTLAASDNYYAGDPLLAYTFERAGEYLLEVRDVRYPGNADWTYSIEVNNRPFVTQAHPLAVRPGAESKVSLVGFNLPEEAMAVVRFPRHGAGCDGSLRSSVRPPQMSSRFWSAALRRSRKPLRKQPRRHRSAGCRSVCHQRPDRILRRPGLLQICGKKR